MTSQDPQVSLGQPRSDASEAGAADAGAAGHGRQPDPGPGRIVVGIDGSPCSIDALGWAVHQADLTGAAIDAVTSWEYPTQYGMEFGVLDVDWAAEAQAVLSTALQQQSGAGSAVITGRVLRGRPAETLVDAAAGADLLVVGSRGHGAMAGMLLGSVSEYVVAHAACPVLVIRHLAEVAAPEPLTAGPRDGSHEPVGVALG